MADHLSELTSLGLEYVCESDDPVVDQSAPTNGGAPTNGRPPPTWWWLTTRWLTYFGAQPMAFVLARSEDDVRSAIRWAVQYSVPFVVSSCGRSVWSSMGSHGIVIDLYYLHEVDIDVDGESPYAKIRGSVTLKTLATRLAERGYFTASGNANMFGAIPHFLNGGTSLTTSLIGYASDQILAARMVDAQGDLVVITHERLPRLLYAIRGAGQFFGIITELTIRIWPIEELGNEEGVVWSARFTFPFVRAPEVAEALAGIMNNDDEATSGYITPDAGGSNDEDLSLVVVGNYIGRPERGPDAYIALSSLQLSRFECKAVPIHMVPQDDQWSFETDHEGFKSCQTVGLRCFDIERFFATLAVWRDLRERCPSAGLSQFQFMWDSRRPKRPDFESANCLHGIRFWQNNNIYYWDKDDWPFVAVKSDDCMMIVRGPDVSEHVDCPNTNRGPRSRCFWGEDRLRLLREVKQEYDPEGRFTRQFLD